MKPAPALRSPAAALLTGLGLCAVIGLAVTQPGYTDDRSLLRFKESKPYLFFILDTSSSMAFKIGNGDIPLVGGSGNPSSRLYAAKQAVFNLFENVSDIHFGFASFNQNDLRVRAKHYLYYNPSPKPADWPFAFPAQDDGLTVLVDRLNLTNADVQPPLGTPDNTDGIPETIESSIQGDAITVGAIFDQDGDGTVDPAEQEAGTCAAPLALGAVGSFSRTKVDTFSILNTDAALKASVYWLTVGGTKYKLTATYNAGSIGQDNLVVDFGLQSWTAACPGSALTTFSTNTVTLRQDLYLKEYLAVDGLPAGTDKDNESFPGLWPSWSDALTNAACVNPHPHSGLGWEGNYDSNDTPPAGVTLFGGYPKDADEFCSGGSCIELKPVTHTIYDTTGAGTPTAGAARPLDRGDMIPFDWNNDRKAEFLQRLAPGYGIDSAPDFGEASYLVPHLKPDLTPSGLYEPRLAGRAPLIAAGNSPIADALSDFRCWYVGYETNKCKGAAPSASEKGWQDIACSLDPEYGCRRPYVIVISDSQNNCKGNSPISDVSDLKNRAGMKLWSINVGPEANGGGCPPPLKNIATRPENCVNVQDPETLLTTIKDILGQIREDARTFASAAVPSVQAIAKQTLYLTDFLPLNNESRWPGHLNAFLKPLPTTVNGTPNTARKCATTTDRFGNNPAQEECFLWDGADVLAKTQNAPGSRNVFYGQLSKPGLWAAQRQPLALNLTEQDVKYDLWRGFGLINADQDDGTLPAPQEPPLQTKTGEIIDETLALQTRSGPCNPSTELCSYLMGDIFHSDPLVFGASFNTDFLRTDAGSEFNLSNAICTAGDETDDQFDRGYRCFAARQGFRRQVVYVGSNDGMLHAFNAAQYRPATKKYDTGTGNELFAYMPRPVMPTVKLLAEGTAHHYAVDGPIHASDAFIDPVDDGGGFPNPDDRRWRTLLVGGLREGGRGYYALDVTQPDKVTGPNDGPFEPDYGSLSFAKPTCLEPSGASAVADCGPVNYASPLWEFTDSTHNQRFEDPSFQPKFPLAMDEDNNGIPDLAFTWSQPDFSRVQLCEGSACTISADPNTSKDVKNHFVVFFGGGFDVAHKDFDPRNAAAVGGAPSAHYEVAGNWIYMVDVETGEVLYKRQVCSPYRTNADNDTNKCVPAGSVSSAIAAIDTDLNGFVDRLYVGTTGGYMFRVDLQVVTTSGSGQKEIKVPTLQAGDFNAIGKLGPEAKRLLRIPEVDSGGNPQWVPYVVFDANWNAPAGTATASLLPRPIFFAPAVIIYQDAGGYALAFGTGDREDLWNANDQEGRFYLFMDDTGTGSPPTNVCATLAPSQGAICPTTEADYQPLTLASAATRADFIRDRLVGRRGWFLQLPQDERIITDTFSFSGLTFFSSYHPQIAITDEQGNPIGQGSCNFNQTNGLCAKTGVSSLFLVSTVNANGLLPAGVRTMQVASFVTNPFTELSTGNTSGGSTGSGGTPVPPPPIPPAIVDLFPKTCRFANARIDISTIAADTSLQRLGSVPICMTEHSWKEF